MPRVDGIDDADLPRLEDDDILAEFERVQCEAREPVLPRALGTAIRRIDHVAGVLVD